MIDPSVFIHPTAVVDEPCTLGAGSKVWHFSHVYAGAQVGRACVLGQNAHVAAKARLGDNVRVQNNLSLHDAVTLTGGGVEERPR